MSENQIKMPKDFEAIKTILENAEIDFEEGSSNGITFHYELANGVVFHFGDNGELTHINNGEEDA